MPISGDASGISKMVTMVTSTAKNSFSLLLTVRRDFMRMRRSFLVVSNAMMGGCISGTRDMYVYAATATAPSRCGASFIVRKMEVGPSAPPMMPMEAASFGLKPMNRAMKNVAATPTWAAAPRSRVRGAASSGPKSVRAPTPRKMMGGKISALMPSPIQSYRPPWMEVTSSSWVCWPTATYLPAAETTRGSSFCVFRSTGTRLPLVSK